MLFGEAKWKRNGVKFKEVKGTRGPRDAAAVRKVMWNVGDLDQRVKQVTALGIQ